MASVRKIAIIAVITCLFTSISVASETENTLSRAAMLLETGKPDSAAVVLFDVLDAIESDNSEERVRALYYLARAMNQLDRIQDELNYLVIACSDSNDTEFADDVRLLYARTLLETGNIDDCITVVRDFREQFVDSPLVPAMLYITGEAYMQKGDYLRATNAFTEISRNHAGSEMAREAIMKEGVCLYHLDLITGAVERLELYVLQSASGENMADALFYLGNAYEKSNMLEQAATAYKRLVTEYPSHAEFMNIALRIGKLYFQMGKYAESENAFENYIFNTDLSDTNRDEALFYLERIKFRTGEYTSENEIAENFITKYPDSPRAADLIFDLGRYYRTMDRVDDAVEKYKILLNNPRYWAYADSAAYLIADTYNNAGQKENATIFLIQTADSTEDPARKERIFIKLGALSNTWELYDEAIGWYDRALLIDAADSLSFRALRGIGKTFTDLSRWFEAAKTYERIIAEYPANPDILDIRVALSNVYVSQGRIADAIKEMEKVVILAKGRKKAEILLSLAELYEDYEEEHALKLYVLIYGNTENPAEFRTKALMKFGDLSLSRGDRKAALSAYNRILSGTADSMAVFEARDRISKLSGKDEPLESNPR